MMGITLMSPSATVYNGRYEPLTECLRALVQISVVEGSTIYVLLSSMPSKRRKAVGCVHPHGLTGNIVAGEYRSDYPSEQHHL
jgi:hypothetical protein